MSSVRRRLLAAIAGASIAAPVSQFVAVGAAGKISTSPDGTTWTARTTGTSTAFNSVAYAPALNLYVAVGASGLIMTSPDAVTWTDRTFNALTWRTVAWSTDLGHFIAGAGQYLYRSTDGITWALVHNTGNASHVFRALLWISALGLWEAVGQAGVLRTSPDGTTWTTRTNPDNMYSIGYSPTSATKIIAGRSAGNHSASSNGTSFSSDSSGAVFGEVRVALWSVSANRWLLADNGGSVAYNTNGFGSWSSPSIGFTIGWYGGCVGNGLYVLVGPSGVIGTSPDAATWTQRTSDFSTSDINAVCYSG